MNHDWEREAQNWIAWARTPGHDPYWYYRDSFFRLLPEPGRRTLDVGCGEGRVARDLAARGHRVTAIDASPTLLRAAQEADPAGDYALGDAAAMPFEDGALDLAVAYNSLMDIEDMPGAVREVARVLEPDGRFCITVTHPLGDAGRFESTEPDAPFVVSGSYFGRRRFEDTFERDGLTMTFRSWCYPLEDYARALEAAGFLIETIREPAAPPERLAARPYGERWRRLPMFLHIRALKPHMKGAGGPVTTSGSCYNLASVRESGHNRLEQASTVGSMACLLFGSSGKGFCR